MSEKGTWCDLKEPSVFLPSTVLGPVQPLGVTSTIAGQSGAFGDAVDPGAPLDLLDLVEHRVERGGELLVHRERVVTLDDVGMVAAAAQELAQLLARDAGEHGRVGDLVSVEVKDRQHRAVGRGVEELVRVPRRRQRPGLGLSVADDARDQEVGIVERRSVRMREAVAELTALVDRARSLGGHVAGDAARERELVEQPLHALLVRRDVAVVLRVACLPDRRSPRGPDRRDPGRICRRRLRSRSLIARLRCT